jgi:hypothetical protein
MVTDRHCNRGCSMDGGESDSDTEVGLVAEDVVEPVSEVGHTDHQREFDDLAFVVILPQLFERADAHGRSTARDTLSVQNGGFLFFIK